MDNGRHNAIFSSPEMNTPEANTPELSTPEADGNLNEENWQKSLEISVPNSLPSPEKMSELATKPSSEAEPVSAEAPDSSLELGQIVSTTTPVVRSENPAIEGAKIKTTGDHLDRASLEVINDAIKKLDQTGDLSDFYDSARDMTEVNLSNSFNRKLGGDHDVGGNA